MDICQKVGRAFCSLKDKKPLVHQITNYVTANDCANITLAAGALPVMADSIDEVEEMTAFADALVINLGTLDKAKLKAMLKSGEKANELGIPIILDPVGVGATSFRKEAAMQIMNKLKISIIRGNLSEIKTLYGVKAITSGVESEEILSLLPDCLNEGKRIAKALAQKLGAVVAVTGEVDIVTDGENIYSIHNGCGAMAKVTGTGCMCSALIGAYAGVSANANEHADACTDINTKVNICADVGKVDTEVKPAYLIAAVTGILSIGIAGEVAYKKIKVHNEGIGSFRVRLIDEIYFLTEERITNEARINKD
jgi:hydroxyethylthiazole kinase